MLDRDQTILNKYRIIQVNEDCPFYDTAVVEHIKLNRYEMLYLLSDDVSSQSFLSNALTVEFKKFGTLAADYMPEFLDYGFYNGKPYFTRKFIPGTYLSEIFSDPAEIKTHDFIEFFADLLTKLIFLQQNYVTWNKLSLSDFKINDGKFFFVHFHMAYSLIPYKEKLNEEQIDWIDKTSGLHFSSESIDYAKNLACLGELLYETLVGKSSKHALQNYHKTFEERKNLKQKKRDLLSPLRLNPNLPEEIENLILKAMHKNTQGGYATIKEFREEILNVIAGEKIDKFTFSEETAHKQHKTVRTSIPESSSSRYNMSIATMLDPKTEEKKEKVYKPKKTYNYRALFKIFVIVLSLAILGYGAYVIIPPMLSKNRQPTAVPKCNVAECKTGDEITFDGTASSDPDNDHLYYFWKVEEPKDAQVIFSKNNAHFAGNTKIIFLTNGDYTITLSVFDGKVYSEPSEVKIKVR